jgi:hypothetical protein
MRRLLIGLLLLAPASADDAWDKVLLLQKVKRQIAAGVKRLPDYTCLQTSERYRRKAGETEQERRVDTLVLEVLNAGDKELYASPGDHSFRGDAPAAFAGHGMSGTGAFGLFLRTLFVNDNAMFQFRGEENLRGRKALRWFFRVPSTLSGYTVQLDYSYGKVGMTGSFVVDAETLELMRLVVSGDEIPPNLQLLSVTQTVDYAPTRIGPRDEVLPQSATMRMIQESGAQSRNVVEFTHCQSFVVETKLSFTPPDAPASAPLPPEPPHPIANGLAVTIELTGPITNAHAVGGLIEARVLEEVRDGRRLVVEAGSAVRGRLRRLEMLDRHWAIGLEFTDIETVAGPARFYANLVDIDKRHNATFMVSVPAQDAVQRPGRTAPQDVFYLPYLPGVAQFFVPQLPLPKGFKTVWKTTSPRSANR